MLHSVQGAGLLRGACPHLHTRSPELVSSLHSGTLMMMMGNSGDQLVLTSFTQGGR